MTQLSERASQYGGELELQSSARAAQVESLLTAGDYEAIREWLEEWETEDKAPNSLYHKYRSARQKLREERYRQRQQRLYGSMLDKITGKASTKDLTRPGADSSQTTAVNES